MKYLTIATAIFFVTSLQEVCRGESKEEAALKTVMLNTCQRGYQAAKAEYTVGTVTSDQVIQWSFRHLNVSVDPTDINKLDARALRLHVDHMDELRRRANFARGGTAHKVDYYYQQARGLAARVDDAYRKQWSDKILDLARLQGEWVEVRNKRRGKPRFQNENDRTISVFGGMSHEGFITLETQKGPKTIDIAGLHEDFFMTTYGIYEFNGDELRFAEHQDGNEKNRPTSFDVGDNDDGIVVYTFKRKKTDEAKPTQK